MNKLLLTSALVLGLAAPALAQSSNVSPSDAVGNASILPGGGSGASNVLPADPGQSSTLPNRNGGSGGSAAGLDNGTTQSLSPNATAPNTMTPNGTTSNLNQPGTSLNGGVVPNSSGSIPNSLNNNGVPGSTSTGPAGGGSSAY